MNDQLAFFSSDAPRLIMDWIDYRQIPPAAGGFSQLFFDYLYEFNNVEGFYPHNFRETDAFEAVMRGIDSRPPDRNTLVRVLHSQNTLFGSSAKTFENLALLEKPSSYAVVTGQQVGLFGGPLYTVFKAITTLKLVERLRVKFPDRDFVPVFWLEGEDHDFAEMNNAALLDAENTPVRIEYLHGSEMPDRNLGAIGELAFDASVQQTLTAADNALTKSDFTPLLLAKLGECYTPGRTFNQAFARWMNYLLGDHGLVFISANHPDLKRLLSPLFVTELSEFPRTSQLVIDQSAALEQTYHAQVKPKSINLFMFHKGGRYLIQPREEKDFSLKGTRHFLQKEELLKIAREAPDQLSPNVVLRPLCQDSLLPTVAYVAGPSEIAYQAQLKPLYEHFGVTQPVIFPRASATLVEERVGRVMERYQLDLVEFFDDIQRVTTKISEQISSIKLDDLFAQASHAINGSLTEMKFGLNEVDPTLIGALETLRSKTDGNLNVLKEKSVAAQKRRNETAVRQVERAGKGLLPNGELQERGINIIYFLNKYGPDLMSWLYTELNVTGFKHQVLTL